LSRKRAKRVGKKRVLIVCEGDKTEPNYLKRFCEAEGLDTIPNIHIDKRCRSTSPFRIVRYALAQFKKDGDYDLVFCVFDKDTHTEYDAALDAIKRARMPRGVSLIPINSVPCVEYWFLLHFIFTTKPFVGIGNKSPCLELCQELKKHIPTYDKGKPDIYDLIGDKTDKAIERSIRSIKLAEKDKIDNPTTRMHILISELRNLHNPS